ncbi:ExbD/TolR family protein [Sinomicrobium weinanense]|uniref:Biopolymer transporter ExbD n=1 Tax=Sinomicrobium weinanense TaxID=2842200 RepID=A0A926JNH0_9FLAO|nr:biopolymer transporter ExbD [Sinomicrobium weinanense]MBC9794533.1 biopolymer transporter ExbD [Sinomicrobium weinanense]MBU3124440.1 biopolymer transporter ExbD [Sinomicrobium weinanense]
MAKFTKKKSGELPAVSTASLPDIVFMLLFFFMTVTVMKDDELMVENVLPTADQVQRLDKKDNTVVYIYAGKPHPRYQDKYGTAARIQLNDKFAGVDEVAPYILAERAEMRQELQPLMTTALKVDKETNMGLISDIKQELRKVNALKVNYTTKEGDAMRNLE